MPEVLGRRISSVLPSALLRKVMSFLPIFGQRDRVTRVSEIGGMVVTEEEAEEAKEAEAEEEEEVEEKDDVLKETEEESSDNDSEDEVDIDQRLDRLSAMCRRHAEGIEAANAAERAALFEIVRQGAAERAASLNRERERLAEAARQAVAGRAEPVKKASAAWSRLRDCVDNILLEITDEASGGTWTCRVLGVAQPEADATIGSSHTNSARLSSGFPASAAMARLVKTNRGRDAASGFAGAICIEPLLDPNRIPIRSESMGGSAFERLFPRHHAWPQAPFLHSMSTSSSPNHEKKMSSRQAKACRLLSLDRLLSARVIHDDAEVSAIESDLKDRRMLVHYILDDHDACPVKVEPTDIPITQYQIEYEATTKIRRRPHQADHAVSSIPALWASPQNDIKNSSPQQNKRLRVRHAPSGARLRCRSRRATTLSLDPVELYTTPLASGNGINVVHMHVNALSDDASFVVIDVRSTNEYQSAVGLNGHAAAVQAAVEATKRKPDFFGRDFTGRQLDYAIIADGKRIVAVLVPDVDDDSDDDADDDTDDLEEDADEFLGLPQGLASSRVGNVTTSSASRTAAANATASADQGNNTQQQSSRSRPVETRFIEHTIPTVGSLVALPDGALGELRGPLPQGLLIQFSDDNEDSTETPQEVHIPSASRFRDQRCRNCGNKCPEALLGIVDVDVVSIPAPRASGQQEPVHNSSPTDNVDLDQLSAVLDMGFDEENARLALAATAATGGSADQAVQWLLNRCDGNGDDDFVANLIASQTASAAKTTAPVMEHRILDEPRRTAYPVCALKPVTQQILQEHRERLKNREYASAEFATASLDKLERMLSSPFESHNKKDILRQARDLKELIDTAVDDGKLMIPPERAARIDRGLRVLAFS